MKNTACNVIASRLRSIAALPMRACLTLECYDRISRITPSIETPRRVSLCPCASWRIPSLYRQDSGSRQSRYASLCSNHSFIVQRRLFSLHTLTSPSFVPVLLHSSPSFSPSSSRPSSFYLVLPFPDRQLFRWPFWSASLPVSP